MAEEHPTTKDTLLAMIVARWGVLQSLLARLTEAETEEPLSDDWSTKVHIGHIAAWERSLLALLRGEDRGEAMGVPPEVSAAHDTDAINAFVASRTVTQPLAEVRAVSAGTHDELVSLLQRMTTEDLHRPYSHYQPNDLPPTSQPVLGWVNGNTWGHYDEHLGRLEARPRRAG